MTGVRKITVLTPDASGNCVGRAHVLACALGRDFAVEIVGPRFGDQIWQPVQGSQCEIKSIHVGASPWDLPRLRGVDRLVEGDLLLASKPLATSYGIALRVARQRGLPLIVDVDDWESGFCRDRWERSGLVGKARYSASSLWRPQWSLSLLNSPRWERRISEADAITVSNSFLQEKFGGERVWHGRDAAAFDPALQDPAACRATHGWDPSWKLITYLGTMTPYKGLDDLIEAVAALADPAVRLVLIGAGEDPHSRNAVAQARSRLPGRCLVLGRRPLTEVPALLAAADAVVIPQRSNPATVGQMPAKLFDAMAAARPIVATDVSDIRECLEGCGWVVEPGNPAAMAEALTELLADPREARRRGAQARARAQERFGYAGMAETLGRIIEKLEPANRRRGTERG